MNKLMFVMWLIIGIAIFASGEVTLFNYGCCWIMLMLELLSGVIDEM